MVEEQDALCVEMESFALFHNAKVLNKRRSVWLTGIGFFMYNEHLSADERQTSFNEMITLALESAIRLAKYKKIVCVVIDSWGLDKLQMPKNLMM